MDAALSVFRLQLNEVWHLAVLGEIPDEALYERLGGILSTGEPTLLSDQVLGLLADRRRQTMTNDRLWVEGHYRGGLQIEPVEVLEPPTKDEGA